MSRAVYLTVLMMGLAAEAKLAPPDMKVFNKTCPTPKLCDVIYENLQACERGNKKQCSQFVDNYRLAIPAYDCQRKFDSSPKENDIVPAIWLCETHEYFLKSLFKMKSKKAKRLFHSQELRTTLDGALAEEYLEKSKGS